MEPTELDELDELFRPAVEDALAETDERTRQEELLIALGVVFLVLYAENGGDQETSFDWRARFLDDMRSAVELLVPDNTEAQVDRMTSWFATATSGAAALYAGQSVPGDSRTKTWESVRDDRVRESHRILDGETVPLEGTWTVKSDPPAELRYPGEPVGPPEAWINCRCTMQVSEITLTAGAEMADEENDTSGFSGVVVVALPEGGGTVTYADGDTTELHQTIAYLGTVDELQPGDGDALMELVGRMAAATEPFTAKVVGKGTLGADQEEVVLTEAYELQSLHESVVADPVVGAMFVERNTHPTWISHITGSDHAAGDDVRFDRLGVWFGGDNHVAFELGGSGEPEEDQMMAAGDPMEDELIEGDDPNIPIHGLAVPEGVLSGDGRKFSVGAIEHRPLPLPLTWQRAATTEHEGEVVVGRLDRLVKNSKNEWWYEGVLLSSVPEFEEVTDLIAEGALRGVSIGGDKGTAVPVTEEELLEAAERGEQPIQEYSSARISNLAIVQIPAFVEGFIAFGPLPSDEDSAEPAPEDTEEPVQMAGDIETFKRGPGWVTDPEPTRRIHDYWVRGEGAAKIRWGTNGDWTRCTQQLREYISPRFLKRTCAEWHHDALGYWPGELGKPGNPTTRNSSEDQMTASAFTLQAAAPPPMVDRGLFNDPKFDGPTALTVREVGGVRALSGHIATWDVCHIGIDKKCVKPPKSRTNYAHFHLGSILTTDGELPVGSLTLGTGHADIQASVGDTRNHYDHTGTMVASVRAGEDAYGIWVAGVVCDGVDDEQVRTLMASGGISGDWRRIGGNLELVAALAVNVPGFPVPRPALAASAAHTDALVAAGVVVNEHQKEVEGFADAVAAALERRQERKQKLASVQDVRAEARAKRVAALRDI